MRDHLTHRYFDTQHDIVADVVTTDLPVLRHAIGELRGHLPDAEAPQMTLGEDEPSHGGE